MRVRSPLKAGALLCVHQLQAAQPHQLDEPRRRPCSPCSNESCTPQRAVTVSSRHALRRLGATPEQHGDSG